MLCDKCQKRQATVHLTKVINGAKEESHLCEECAKEAGMMPSFHGFGDFWEEPFSFPNMFGSFFNPSQTDVLTGQSEARCPHCGTSLRELQQDGRLGCASCYDTFRPQLERTLKSIHGNIRHRGKLAKSAGEDLLARKELESLKKQLSKAIADEEYEEAAKLRDQIRNLEKGA